uniref:Sulfotransferase domain-containing protein n=1 Tax=Roseihalotalea indica TaxID=2867963 RepID=A0AA49GQW5_9BACT|nr:sulfotransferase domain-containing protein [Tunicatimonas sp. TK19036]
MQVSDKTLYKSSVVLRKHSLFFSDTEAWFPNLFVPGAGRSGTTTLFNCLNQHPDIYMAKDKEPDFFSNDNTFQLQDEYYKPLFLCGRDHRYRGEASVSYMTSLKAATRIKHLAQSPRFIFILRNPIDRAISHYYYWQSKGFEHQPFNQAFESSFTLNPETEVKLPDYYAGSCYGKWIKYYQAIFGSQNIHIITTESLKDVPVKVINSCFSFLDLPLLNTIKVPYLNSSGSASYSSLYKDVMNRLERNNTFKSIYQKLPVQLRIVLRRKFVNSLICIKGPSNSSNGKPIIDHKVRRWVADYYHDDVEALKKLTDLSFIEWPEFR